MTVRPAEPADAEQVARVHAGTWQHAYAGIVPDDVLDALDDQVEERARRARERWSSPEPSQFRTLVAVDSGRVVGFATYGPYRRDHETVDPSVGEVLAIYVSPAHQGRGGGRALMDAAVDDLRSDGFHEVRLWVLEENGPSRRFYERYGFATDGERHFYRVERPDGTPVDLPEVRYTLAV